MRFVWLARVLEIEAEESLPVSVPIHRDGDTKRNPEQRNVFE